MAKIDEQISYNWLFFLLAGAFGAVTFWAVYDETATRREYKNYQEAFFKIETDLADKALKAQKDKLTKNAEYQSAVAEKKKLESELAGPKRGAFEAEKAKLQELEFTAADKQQNFTFTKSLLDETYYYYTKSKHEVTTGGSPKELSEREEKLHKYEAQLAKDEKIMNDAAKARDEQAAKVNAFTSRITELGKLIDKLETDEKDAERKYATAADKQSGLFGPATEIQQQNLEDIGRVDRCESCHVGSNRGGFETVSPAYFRSHPYRRTLFTLHPVEKFGCTTCHDGQGRATTKFFAHAPADRPHDFEKHFWEEPLLKGPMMEANCRKCHMNEFELRSFIRCETADECPQKPQKMECKVPAQPLNPSDTSIPNFLPQAAAEGVGGRPAAEAAKYCVDTDVGNAVLVDLAPHLARGRKIIEETGCFGCHPIEGYDRPKPGPDLRHVKSKLNPGWMVEWIKNPKALHKNTRMPNFFPEELQPADYPKTALPIRDDKSKNPNEPWKWTIPQQTTALTSFLLAQSTPFESGKLPLAGNAERGKQLVLDLGCRGCHNLTYDEKDASFIDHKNRASHYDHGPNLKDTGSKTSIEWIFAWLKDPKSYAPGTRMPNLRLTDQEAADVATYLASNKDTREFPMVPGIAADDKDVVKSGEKLMNYYGCYGCHMINGYEQTAGIGVELTEFGIKEVTRLDYGDYIVQHNLQTWEAWLENKLKHPRVYRYERVDTRMPQFDFTPEEITDIMVVLKGARGKQLDSSVRGHKLTPIEAQRERGRELVRWYNCYGCHIVDGYVGDIRQAKEYEGDRATFAPPNISGEGAKTQPPWLFGFFKNVVKLRPWLSVRMPTFGFDDEQATSLVAMFSALDHADYPYRYYDVKNEGPKKAIGAALFTNLKCTSCHVVGDVKLTPEEAQKAAPNFLMAKNRLRAEWIVKWLSNPEWIQPGTRMPSFWASGSNFLQAIMGTPDGKKTFGGLPGIEQVADSPLHQMEVVRDHIFTLEGGAAASSPKAQTATKKKAAAPAPKKHASLN
ncbi:MAG TPA: c-type cytochrome [Polyangia bacterium]|nr:c-type cytochrome [Polyangia bacterium]